MIIFGIILFLIGLIFGSFLNSLIYRIDSKHTFSGRSFCPQCKKSIAWYDNIPLLSFFLLKGRCRKCKKPISIQYPAVELLTASLFLLIGLFSEPGTIVSGWLNRVFNGSTLLTTGFQFSIFNESTTEVLQSPTITLISLGLLLTTCFLLLTIAIYDAKTKYVLTFYAYAAALVAIFYNFSEYLRLANEPNFSNLIYYISPFFLAAFIPAAFFWLISKLSKEKFMGSGDADIALAIGFLLGWPKILPAYYFAFISGAVWGLFLLATKKAGMKSEVPFGPFLIAGAFFGIIFGEQIIAWYTGIVFGI
jgi:prepilin signal peptidase PulO-like enzyme (type II secretory pathway)